MIAVSTVATIYIVSNVLRDLLNEDHLVDEHLSLSQLIDRHAIEYGWMLKFSVNCFGYACIFVPGFAIYLYTQRIKYLERCGKCSFNSN